MHSASVIHLVLEPINPPATLDGFPGVPLTADHKFSISIQHFAADIADAGQGYLTKLTTSADLQVKFVSAVYDFYDPQQ